MRQRAALLLFLGLACGLLASCRVNLAEVPLLRLLERRSGLISFIAADGNVHVIDQAGTGNKAITGDAGSQAETSVMYTAVTWAPDGNHLAFSRFVIHSGDVSEASLYSAGASGRAPVRLFSSRRIVPFYLSWSPDSRRISLLSQVKGESDLELGVSPAGRQEAYTAVDWGAPYYWNWLADSSSVAAHANAQLGSKMGERLSMITLDPVPHRTDMPVQTDLFQAPDISPDGRSIAYATGSDGGFTLRVRGLDGSAERTIATDTGTAYFGFAPDGNHVAYLAAFRVQPVPQGILSIVSLRGTPVSTKVTEAPVLAFFWAPDGRRLALIVPDTSGGTDPLFQASPDQLNLRIVGCDATTAKTWTIARFPATRGLLSILPFFDQYQRSATIWSPDSSRIVFTALSPHGDPAVYVARADGSAKPRFLTAGDSAFWSWK